MRWQDWRDSEVGRRWTNEALARELGVHTCTVARLHRTRPRGDLMEGIARLTGLAVMPNDWFPDLGATPITPREPPIQRRGRQRAPVMAAAA